MLENFDTICDMCWEPLDESDTYDTDFDLENTIICSKCKSDNSEVISF